MVSFVLNEEFFSCIYPFGKLRGQLAQSLKSEARSYPLLFYFSLSDFVAIFEGKCYQEFLLYKLTGSQTFQTFFVPYNITFFA